MAPLVDVDGLRYRYPESSTLALDHVSLRLEGGLVAVAGPSGGGKSTLLRLLNGLVPHMYGGTIAGRAIVDGRDVLRTPARRLATSVGFVFQDAERQAVHATVERDVAFGLENRGVPPGDMHSRVNAVLERLGIVHLRARTIATLSGGERQRVAVAGALVLEPRLLVLDEPFSQLDHAGTEALLALCLELRDAGTAVVVSEHRLDELLPVADGLVSVAGGAVTAPLRPRDAAATLDSAPQVVRLSAAMGWSPTLLDASELSLPRAESPRGRRPALSGTVAWSLEGVATAPGTVLSEVSVAGHAGEVVALMGVNGSGKTSLLRVIAGLSTPRAGNVNRHPGRVAYLPQNPAALLYRETVGAEIAWTMARDHHADAGSAQHRQLIEDLGVGELADRDPRDLSSGERQRAAIAAILCGAPAVALLDEPTRGMDGAARRGLVGAVRGLAARGASVLIATHDSDLAATIADRVLLIEDGTVRDRGAPTDALSGNHPYATQLGRHLPSPGPVTVDAVAALLRDRGEVTAR